MITEEEYELAVDEKCFQIRLVQKELAQADVPDALSYNYGGDQSARDLLLSELDDLAAKWGEGATTLQKIHGELDALNKRRDPYDDLIVVERLDVAVKTAIETRANIERVAQQVADLEIDPMDEWTDDAQELIERLAFPTSPIRLYDWRGILPRWYGLEGLYPFDEIGDEHTGAAKLSWAALFGNPLSSIPAQIFGLVRKYVKPHQEALKVAFSWVVIGLAITLFPYHPGYSFGALTVGIAVDCYWGRYWGDFFETVMFWGALYGCVLVWFG